MIERCIKMCKNKQVLNNKGICISESLGLCEGCANEFFNDLSKEGFSGLRIDEKGIKTFNSCKGEQE